MDKTRYHKVADVSSSFIISIITLCGKENPNTCVIASIRRTYLAWWRSGSRALGERASRGGWPETEVLPWASSWWSRRALPPTPLRYFASVHTSQLHTKGCQKLIINFSSDLTSKWTAAQWQLLIELIWYDWIKRKKLINTPLWCDVRKLKKRVVYFSPG